MLKAGLAWHYTKYSDDETGTQLVSAAKTSNLSQACIELASPQSYLLSERTRLVLFFLLSFPFLLGALLCLLLFLSFAFVFTSAFVAHRLVSK